jgi:cell division protein FtsI/penicillin-binding protein 2
MLVSVVELGHGKRAGVAGYYVAGKTGTAQVPLPNGGGYDPQKSIGSFVGFAPVDNPRFAMVVRINEPADVVFAESTAAPVFGEVAKFLLQYYQVPPTRPLK